MDNHPEEQKRREMAAAKKALGPAVLSQVLHLPVDDLVPYANNARIHSDEQNAAIEKSIETFGFVNPVLVDINNVIIAGHGRVMAAKRLGMATVPVLRVEALTPDQVRAYRLADNRIAELAGWDDQILSIELQHLGQIELGFSLDALGWKPPEVEIIVNAHLNSEDADTHYAELSRLSEGVPYPLWDLTSSGLTETWPYIAPNRLRVGEGYSIPNYGRIAIDWERNDPLLMLEAETVEGRTVISQPVPLSSLRG